MPWTVCVGLPVVSDSRSLLDLSHHFSNQARDGTCRWNWSRMPHHTQRQPLALRQQGIVGKQAQQCRWSITGRGAVMLGCQATGMKKQESVRVGVVGAVHLHTPRSPARCWFHTCSLGSTQVFESFNATDSSFHSSRLPRPSVLQATGLSFQVWQQKDKYGIMKVKMTEDKFSPAASF